MKTLVALLALAATGQAAVTVQVGPSQPVVKIIGDDGEDDVMVQPYISQNDGHWYFRVLNHGVQVYDSQGIGLRNGSVFTFHVLLGDSDNFDQGIDLRLVRPNTGFSLMEETQMTCGHAAFFRSGNSYYGSEFRDRILDNDDEHPCFIWGWGAEAGDYYEPGPGGSIIFDKTGTDSEFHLGNGWTDSVSLGGGNDNIVNQDPSDIINP